ncbi:uncharacterized protein LOC143177486 [Calliopsis andreniformis]|uniref:uncharacterized protein LOC143177486 n=1 Tax=Calliopsis andreniformis TaxID=337506 RepID=UPI003FCE0D2D
MRDQHLVQPEPIVVRELPGSKSDSALSSSAKRPATSTPEREEDLRSEASTSRRPSPSANVDDFAPEEAVPSMHEDENTDDDPFRLIEDQREFKVPQPKKTSKSRKTKRERGESSRTLRSRTREEIYVNYEYSDDDFEQATKTRNPQPDEEVFVDLY